MSGEDQVKLVPVLGSWVSPGDSVLELRVEECICDAETMVAAEFQ